MTPAEFKVIYPEFASVDDAIIQRQIDQFACLYQGDYGCSEDYLLGLYVAHQTTVFSTTSGSGPVLTVTARTVDNMSWTYGQQQGGSTGLSGSFASTKYGVEFSSIMMMFGQGPVMAGAAT